MKQTIPTAAAPAGENWQISRMWAVLSLHRRWNSPQITENLNDGFRESSTRLCESNLNPARPLTHMRRNFLTEFNFFKIYICHFKFEVMTPLCGHQRIVKLFGEGDITGSLSLVCVTLLSTLFNEGTITLSPLWWLKHRKSYCLGVGNTAQSHSVVWATLQSHALWCR